MVSTSIQMPPASAGAASMRCGRISLKQQTKLLDRLYNATMGFG